MNRPDGVWMLTASAALLIVSIVSQPRTEPDGVLATHIRSLLHELLTIEDAPREEAVRSEARRIFLERGLPTIADVGDEAAYEFVVLVCSGGPVDDRSPVVAAAQEAAARHTLPGDAAVYCEARVREDRVKEAARRHPPTHPALRDEIQRMVVADQAVRQRENFDMAKMQRVDAEHAARLAAIFERYGVPTYGMVGPEAASNFIILIQHQPPEFRRKVLPKLEANVEAGQADGRSYASAYDRSQVDQGLDQMYGENLVCDSQQPVLHESPIEDEAHVDMRRARVGLFRLALYVRLVQELSPDLCRPSGQ